MFIKDNVTPATGATATFHVLGQVAFDYTGDTATEATVSSYLSQEMYAAGKYPMYMQQIPLEGLPAAGQDARDYAEALLVAEAPADTPSTFPNRYVFSGGSILLSTASE